MAAWRRRALELFPSLQRDLNDREYSIHFLFADLRRLAWVAHDEDDEDTLRGVYGFAASCLGQRSQNLSNPAAVSFYEHLFDERKDRGDWAKVIAWLSPEVVRDVWGLWEWRLSAEELHDLRKLLSQRGIDHLPAASAGNRDKRGINADKHRSHSHHPHRQSPPPRRRGSVALEPRAGRDDR